MSIHPKLPKIAGYEVRSLLGQGYSGQVFRATRTADSQECALKVFRPERCKGLEGRRLEREARALTEHAHPCLVPLLERRLDAAPPYLSFLFMAGGDLAERLEDEARLPSSEALAIGARLAAALAHLHSRGVVHRDLKPANVLLDKTGRAFLGDLGLSRAADDMKLTASGQMVGTWSYMAPEVQSGHPAVVASDVYSFSALFVELMTGEIPQRRAQGIDVPPALGTVGLPVDVLKLVRRSLRTEPSDRPRDLLALGALLKDLTGEPRA